MGIEVTLSVLIVITLILIGVFMDSTNETFTVELAPVGYYMMPSTGNLENLKEYLVDRSGKLYSVNLDTWEIDPKKGKHILICSDFSISKSGDIINSLRSIKGNKVTVPRKKLKFDELKEINGSFEFKVKVKDHRHLTITDPNFVYGKVTHVAV